MTTNTLSIPEWKKAQADEINTRVDTIERALIALSEMDGMFAGREEISTAIQATYTLLNVEVDNLRLRAERLLVVREDSRV